MYKPQIRTIISILGMYACGLMYVQRAGMSVAIVSMTSDRLSSDSSDSDSDEPLTHYCAVRQSIDNHSSTPNTGVDTSTPPPATIITGYYRNVYDGANGSSVNFMTINQTTSQKQAEFDWNEKLQGIVLGAPFYLHIVVPIFAGRMTDAIGGKWIVFCGMFFPFVLSALAPVATRTIGVGALIAIQALIGGFHACIYPAFFSIYVQWFPSDERANANAGLIFGSGIGNSIMYALAGYLCKTEIGWPLVFYATALFHVPWLLGWLYYSTNEPSTNKRISSEELKFIKSRVQEKMAAGSVKAPWMSIMFSLPVWCSMITKMCNAFGYFLLLSKTPSYLNNVYGIEIIKNGTFNAASTFASGISGLIGAPIANLIIRRFPIKSITVRKIFQSIAMMGPALCLCLITVMECNLPVAIASMIGAMFCYGFFTGGEWTVVSDFAPNFAGTVFGIANALAFTTGVVAPYFVGVVLDREHGTLHEKWNMIFYITTVIYLVGSLTFIFLGTDQQQQWDKIGEQNSKTETTNNSKQSTNDIEIVDN